MQCISPLRIKPVISRQAGTAESKRNGSVLPADVQIVTRSDDAVFVPCGKCNFCLERRRYDWSFRLANELRKSHYATFLTLTYDDTKVPYNKDSGEQTLLKRDFQLFKKRLRKVNAKLAPELPIRYYSIGEYGELTSRPHYHSVLFNCHPKTLAQLQAIWTHGHIHAGQVTPASIHYVTSYVITKTTMDYSGREPPFALMSRKPGLGSDYLRTHKTYHKIDQRNYTHLNGILGRLPRYYKDKIFTGTERQLMAKAMLELADNDYQREINRLSQFHRDPARYYDECIANQHDSIKSEKHKVKLI